MVVLSRLEAFGQTASEAQAYGTSVVLFDIGCLLDIIEHPNEVGKIFLVSDGQDLSAADFINYITTARGKVVRKLEVNFFLEREREQKPSKRIDEWAKLDNDGVKYQAIQ
jgi:glycosyltransferase involved in cell wall biosynthesis